MSDRRAGAGKVFLYHFVVEDSGKTIHDQKGIALPSDTAAFAHGERFVRQSNFSDQERSLTLVIKKQGYDVIQRIPFQMIDTQAE